MSDTKKGCYKYCIVPKCTSSTIKTPDKIFFCVPMQKDRRKKWCKVMKRDLIGPKSMKYVCEDHFDLENDTENLVKYKLVGGRLKLKGEVYPHKFNCQQKIVKPVTERGAYEKRRRAEYFESLLNNDVPSTSSCQALEVIEDDSVATLNELNVAEDKSIPDNPPKSFKHKRVQVNVKVKQKNKEVQTIITRNKTMNPENMSFNLIHSPSNSSVSKMSISSQSSESSLSTVVTETKPQYCIDTTLKISRYTVFYLGLPEDVYFLTELLSESVASSVRDILISLKKIRLNDSYLRLAIDFDLNKSTICKIFHKTIPLIANRMKQLIFFPPKEEIYANLPISFRKRYSKTVSILDCFEIQIEKPSSSVQQALTWSEYKHCNTIKYLISITPDGLINFISDGYGGRATDTAIFEDCNFLQNLPRGCSVMADRGFKNISHLLEAEGCRLIRPPSVTAGKASSKSEVIETKRIAALRINVERTIGRLRDFSMVAPHACIDTKMIYVLDYIVLIACGMVNVQNKLIKT